MKSKYDMYLLKSEYISKYIQALKYFRNDKQLGLDEISFSFNGSLYDYYRSVAFNCGKMLWVERK